MDHGRERRTHSMGSCVRAGGGLRGVGGAPDARAGGSVGGATPRAGSRRARGARRGARRRRREKRRREKGRRRNLHRDLREKREGEHTRAILRRRDSSRGGHGRFRVGTETHAETDVGLGDRIGGAAVQRGRRVGAFRPDARARLSAYPRGRVPLGGGIRRRRGGAARTERARALLRLVQGGHAGGHRVAEQERRLGGPGGGRRRGAIRPRSFFRGSFGGSLSLAR